MSERTKIHYKILIVVAMLYISCIIAADVFTYKIISVFHYQGSASLIVFPLIFLLSDMITELYGKVTSRFFLYTALVVECIFDVLFSQLIYLPSPGSFTHQAAYNLVIGALPRIFVGVIVSLLISSLLNIFLMSKWKRKLFNRSYSVRSILSSITGEAVFILIGYTIWFYGIKPVSIIAQLMLISFVSKIVFTLILVWPITAVVYRVKERW